MAKIYGIKRDNFNNSIIHRVEIEYDKKTTQLCRLEFYDVNKKIIMVCGMQSSNQTGRQTVIIENGQKIIGAASKFKSKNEGAMCYDF
jgi:hypothetical protein